jgi:hypothetical protein
VPEQSSTRITPFNFLTRRRLRALPSESDRESRRTEEGRHVDPRTTVRPAIRNTRLLGAASRGHGARRQPITGRIHKVRIEVGEMGAGTRAEAAKAADEAAAKQAAVTN